MSRGTGQPLDYSRLPRSAAQQPFAHPPGLMRALPLAQAWLLLMALGFVAFRLPGAMVAGNEMSIERAVFTVANAATLAGFQQSVAIDNYGVSGIVAVATLMVAGTLFALIVGGMAVVRIARMRHGDKQVIEGSVIAVAVAAIAGGAALVDLQRGVMASMAQAVGALGNSGLAFGAQPTLLDWHTHAILLPLALAGGLSVPVLLDIAGVVLGRGAISRHSRVVLAMSALVYLLGVIALYPWNEGQPFAAGIASASFASLNARSLGLPVLPLSAIARVAQWALVLLMVVGAAPGGTGGGIKVTTPFELIRGVADVLRGRMPTRMFAIASVWLWGYLILTAGAFLALVALQPELPADRLLFIAVSASSCTGLSQDPITMTGASLYVLATVVILGRVLPLAVLWWAAQTARSSDVAVA